MMFTVIDLETTGFTPNDRVLEIGALRLNRRGSVMADALDIDLASCRAKLDELDLYPRDLSGKSVVFTGQRQGTLGGRSLSRTEVMKLAVDRGLTVKSGVSRKVDFVVVRDPHTRSGKAKKARELGIP